MRRAVIGLFVLCAVLFVAPGGTQGASFYSPCGNVALSSVDAGTPSAITTTFGVGLDPATCGEFESATERPPEWNADTIVDFTPPEWHVARDADTPDGMQVGELDSRITVGLFTNGCNYEINADMTLLEGTTDVHNPVDANPPGTPDRLKPLSIKDATGTPAAASIVIPAPTTRPVSGTIKNAMDGPTATITVRWSKTDRHRRTSPVSATSWTQTEMPSGTLAITTSQASRTPWTGRICRFAP